HLSRSSPLVMTSLASDIRFASSGRGSYSSTCALAGTIEPTDMRSPATCFVISARIVVVVRTCALPPATRAHPATGAAASRTSRRFASLFTSSPITRMGLNQIMRIILETPNRGVCCRYGTNSHADGARETHHLAWQAPHEAAGHSRAGPCG